MKLTELYGTLISREMIPYERVKAGQRIAAILPLNELDIMKIESVGSVTTVGGVTLDTFFRPGEPHKRIYFGGSRYYDVVSDELAAVAKVCPGQASMKLKRDGTLSLNELTDVMGELPPTAQYQYQIRHWPNSEYNSGWKRLADSQLGVLYHHTKAHWIILRQYPIVGVSRAEMKELQRAIEALHPELAM